MSPNLSLSHHATTILYSPPSYTFDNDTSGWLSSPTGHSTLLSNASFQIEWTGKGIHVDGLASGNGSVLISLDGGPFNLVQANQTSGLANYPSLGFGGHTLVVGNVPGGNLTLTGYSLLDLENLQEGRTVARRELPSMVQNSTGSWVQNPEFIWDGDWAARSSGTNAAPIMNTRPRSLTSFYLNVSDCSLVEIYGVGTTYSLSFYWTKDSVLSRRSLTSSDIVRRDETTHFPGENLQWKKSLDRAASYLIEVDVIPNGGQWGVTRVVVTDSLPSKGIKVIIGVAVPLGILIIALLFFAFRRYKRRKSQRGNAPKDMTNMEISSPLPNKSTMPPRYSSLSSQEESDGDFKSPSPQYPQV